MDEGLAVFFDIGDTLASAVIERGRLSRLDVYRFVPDILARLRAGDVGVFVSVGLISNTGGETAARMNRVLADAGLLALVDARLCLFSSVEGLDKSQPAFSGSPGTAPPYRRPAACSRVRTQRSGRWRPRLAFGYRPIRCTRCTWSRASSSPSPTPEWRGILTCLTSKPLAMA
jgi:hypothetical protein